MLTLNLEEEDRLLAKSDDFEPAYLKFFTSGELKKRVKETYSRLETCDICPRECKVNRLETSKGTSCHTGKNAVVSSHDPHFGEEAPLVGRFGSGTIFFAWCNLRCCFCQNYDISQLGIGKEVSSPELASMMMHLQDLGCHNINLVSPTHVVPQILDALIIAVEAGLKIPLVYNTGGYDSLRTLNLLDGIIDIYMPDMKYSDAETALKYSKVKNYPAVNRAAVREMHRQVGDLVLDSKGLAQRGLLVRHLVLPNGLAGTDEIVRFLSEEISKNTYLNIMDQYRPCYKASEYLEINRSITRQEYEEAIQLALREGLTRLDKR